MNGIKSACNAIETVLIFPEYDNSYLEWIDVHTVLAKIPVVTADKYGSEEEREYQVYVRVNDGSCVAGAPLRLWD